MKLWFWLNGEKISPLACLRARARKNGITCITDFGPNMLRFFRGANLWLWGHQHETYRDQSVLLGEHISQKFPSTPTYNKQSKQNTHKQSWQIFKIPTSRVGKILKILTSRVGKIPKILTKPQTSPGKFGLAARTRGAQQRGQFVQGGRGHIAQGTVLPEAAGPNCSWQFWLHWTCLIY